MRIRYYHLIVLALIAVSGVLAYDAFKSYINPYLTVSQIAESNEVYLAKKVQILGIIANGSTQIGDNGALIFNLTDGEAIIRVTYTGNPPQNFMEGGQAVAVGTLVSSHSLEASQILIRCPSKYEEGRSSSFTQPIFLAAILGGSTVIGYTIISVVLKRE